MKKIDDKEYYNISEIHELLHKELSKHKILEFFENGKLNGLKENGEWLASEEAIENLENKLMEDKIHFVGEENIDLSDLRNEKLLKGRILDIGGGGEGIIGQMFEDKVIAIDPSRRELEEVKNGDFIKLVMDAKDIKFLNNTFETVTDFFTFMYIPSQDHEIVFKEVYRVLKKGGAFFIWDLNIPKKPKESKDIFAIRLKINIGVNEIETGYGTKWNKEQNLF
jgi:SAM-dependent methyltransferase